MRAYARKVLGFFLLLLMMVLPFNSEAYGNADISGTVLAGSSGAGGPVYVVAQSNSVFGVGDDYGFALLSSPGAYTLENMPEETVFYIFAIYDHDNSESITVGDYTGVYESNPVILSTTDPQLTGYDITLGTEVLGATVTGTVTCDEYTSGDIIVRAYEDSDNEIDEYVAEVTLATGPGPYSFTLPVGGRLYIKAFWDTDGTPGVTALDQSGEHQGNPITVSSSGNNGVNITIEVNGFITGIIDDGYNPIENLHVYVTDDSITYPDNSWVDGTYTNANGIYTFSLPNGDYTVYACPGCSGHSFVRESKQIKVTAPAIETANFSLEIGGVITGTVTDSVGGGIDSIHVYVVDADNPDYDSNWIDGVNTDQDGVYSFVLSSGNYTVHVCPDCSGHDFVSPSPQSVTLTAPDIETVNFVLSSGGTITGTITDTEGAPIANLSVGVDDYFTGDFVNGGQTDASGFYSITVPAGSYKVSTCADCAGLSYVDEFYNDKGSDNANQVDVTEGEETGNINFVLETGREISGTITGSSGSPIANLQVDVIGWESGLHVSGRQTDEFGYYSIIVPPGTYSVQACPNCSGLPYVNEVYPSEVDVTQGDQGGVDFQLSSGATIFGRVADAQDQPIVDLHVQANNWNDGIQAAFNLTDENGEYTITVDPGSYMIQTCAVTCSQLQYADEASGQIILTEGQNYGPIDFQLTEGGVISGHVLNSENNNPISGVQIYFEKSENGEWVAATYTNNEGYYEVRLKSGTYNVVACTDCDGLPYIRETVNSVTVAELNGITVDFSLTVGGSISGTLYDVDTSLPITGIQDIYVQAVTGDSPCGQLEYKGQGIVDPATGEFTITGLPSGEIFIQTVTGCNFYMDQMYDSNPGTNGNCEQDPVILTVGQQATGRDFELVKGGMISGEVTFSNGTTPIRDLDLMVMDSSWLWLHGGQTDQSGAYCFKVTAPVAPTVTGVYVQTCAVDCSGLAFIDEIYNNAFTQGTASIVNVSKGIEVSGINFSLNEIISGDVDGDEDVDLSDLIKGLQIMSGINPEGNIFRTGDINADGKVGMPEMLFILDQVAE